GIRGRRRGKEAAPGSAREPRHGLKEQVSLAGPWPRGGTGLDDPGALRAIPRSPAHCRGSLCRPVPTAATPSAYRGAMSIAQRERAALVEILRAEGPDAPTLCEGWTACDLS